MIDTIVVYCGDPPNYHLKHLDPQGLHVGYGNHQSHIQILPTSNKKMGVSYQDIRRSPPTSSWGKSFHVLSTLDAPGEDASFGVLPKLKRFQPVAAEFYENKWFVLSCHSFFKHDIWPAGKTYDTSAAWYGLFVSKSHNIYLSMVRAMRFLEEVKKGWFTPIVFSGSHVDTSWPSLPTPPSIATPL